MDYICNEVLCTQLSLVDAIDDPAQQTIEIIEGQPTTILLTPVDR
jgi:hypothetical protein